MKPLNTGYDGQWLPLRLLFHRLVEFAFLGCTPCEPDSPLRNRNRNIIPWVAFF